MGIATIVGIILGLVVAAASFVVTSLAGSASDATSIAIILGGCAAAGALAFVIAHLIGLPRIVERAQDVVLRGTIGSMIERRGQVITVVSGIVGLVAMVVILRDPGAMRGFPITALFASVCGAVVLNIVWRPAATPVDEPVPHQQNGMRMAGNGPRGNDGFKKAA